MKYAIGLLVVIAMMVILMTKSENYFGRKQFVTHGATFGGAFSPKISLEERMIWTGRFRRAVG